MRVSREDLIMLLAAAMVAVGASLTAACYLRWWADILAGLA